jgi:CDP-diacylglycerol--serine O-phosphatidyltransferase
MRAPVHDIDVSNLLTYASLTAAVGAIASARAADGPALAGALLAVAALADTFDGRFAHVFTRSERQRRIGRDLDSLADIVAFGVAPVAVSASLAPPESAVPAFIWWTAACAYVLAAATRLSFYNCGDDDAGFIGLPTPVAALIWATCLLLTPSPSVVAALFVVVGAAMVSPLAIPRPRGLALAAFALWPAALVVLNASRIVE